MTDKPTTDADRHAAGMTVRRKVLGDAHVDRAIAATTPLTEDFQNLITRYAWGEIWSRPGLDVRTRRTLVIGTLVALGQHEELAMHVRAALASGDLSAERREGDRAAAGDLLRRSGGERRLPRRRRGDRGDQLDHAREVV